MLIQLKKFGTTLISRQAGKEALAAFEPVLREATKNEKIEIDFAGVVTFTPSWGDEFLTPLQKRYGKSLLFRNTENLSVQATLQMLEEINKDKFVIKKLKNNE
ncbi:MAG TPA: hypothetical protein DCS28_02175 [Candidatus Moranbacteria bacterium]|nr:hypothetical protein [Candidatus Moranbacteria bacterium]HAT74821.1 hypothetical protein [Candidatus Moranbacteria bacterium]